MLLLSSFRTSDSLQLCLNCSRYRENAVRISRAFNDRPISPLDTAIFWTEYVIRHRGALHLRSAARDLPSYQYLLLDISAVLLSVAIFISVTAFYITKAIVGFVLQRRISKEKKSQWYELLTWHLHTDLQGLDQMALHTSHRNLI
jgi:glucuronosyltransferase